MQNYNKLSARVLSLALSAAMVFTSFSTTVFAAEEAAPLGASGDLTADSIITAFDALGEGFEKSDDGHTYLRSVELNTPFEEVGLPTELGVTVKHLTTATEPVATEPVATEPVATEPVATEPTATEPVATEPVATEPVATEPATTEPVATEPVVTEPTATEPEAEKKSAPEQISSLTTVREEIIPVTWNGDRDYTPAENSKVLYTAVLPEGYALADGVKLPTINVMVGKQPMTAIAAMPREVVKRTEPLDLTKSVTYVAEDNSNKTADPTTTDIKDTKEGWSWDFGTKTLTLSGANIDITLPDDDTSNHSGISLPADAKVEITNKNSISISAKNAYILKGVYGGGNLTVGGSGSLILITDTTGINYGLNNEGVLTIDGGTFNIHSDSTGIEGLRGIIINGGTITSQGYIRTGFGMGTIKIKAGYTLMGNDGEFINDNTEHSIPFDSEGNPPLVITFSPVVAFAPSNGVVIDTVPVANSAITLPAEPTWGDYTFAGWYTDQDYTTPFVNEGLTTSAMLYAKWTAKNGKTVRTIPLHLEGMLSADKLATDGWKWNADAKTLSLDGATMHVLGENYAAIDRELEDADGSTPIITVITIETHGNNTLISGNGVGIAVQDNLAFKGDGSLRVDGGRICITAWGNVTVESGNVTAVAYGDDSMAMGIASGANLIVSGGTLLAAGLHTERGVGMNVPNDLIITGGDVTAKGSMFAAMINGKITAEGAVVTGSATMDGTMEPVQFMMNADMGMLMPVLVSDGTTQAKHINFSNGKSVSFDPRNGGAAIPSAEISDGGTITLPAAPTWGDYTFAGWYTDVDGKGTAFVNSGLTASTKVYAKWTKNGKAVRTEPLYLTGGADLSGEGWKWDNTAKTLTLDGITLNSSKVDNDNANAILFPNASSTIILVDGTENTVDVSSAKGRITNSSPIATPAELTIKTSGKGTPGKLNAIAGKADGPSFGIYADGGLVIESGNITATAGESVTDNSVGISANLADIHIKGGTVNATGGKSGGSGMAGSFGLYGANVQIDDGAVTATGGEATTDLKLSAGIVGRFYVRLNGGNIHANGNTAAVAALISGVVIDDIANVTVNDKLAKVGKISIGGITEIFTMIDEKNAIVKDAKVKFKPNYTGENTLAPNAYTAIKTHDSITLPTQEVAGETVEYGIEKSDGTITWQDSAKFSTPFAKHEYTFYTRVKGNAAHKAGTTSPATKITTKQSPVSVSGTVKDSNDSVLAGATVTLTPSSPLLTANTKVGGDYIIANVPEGVYSLVVTKGTGSDTVTITETVIVKGDAISGNDIKFLDGKKNTVVESADNAPEIAVGGMNDLLTGTKLDETLTQEERAAVNAKGSVDLTFKAKLKDMSDAAADKSAIEGVADDDQKIDLLLDLSVLKTVKDGNGKPVTTDKKITELAGIIAVNIPIPAELQGKTNLRLYRMHAGKPELLKKDTADANGEYYTIDPSGTFMTLYVKNFSTYALGYSTFTVTIADGGTGASGSGKYSNGDIVTVSVGSKSGYSFDGWTVAPGTVTLANPGSATTTFTMPDKAVTVTAVWTYTGGGSGGGSSDDNGEYEFWMQGKDKIDNAKNGDVIKLNLKSNDKMPASVMAALRKNPGVSLVITWNGGKTITIPAGKAAKQEDGRIYYPLSMLAELYAGFTEDSVLKSTAPQNPQTGGPGSFISAAGGELITLEAPTPTLTENAQANIVTPPDAGFEANAFAGTPDASAAGGTSPIAVAAVVLLLAAIGGGWVLLWKRDSKEQE